MLKIAFASCIDPLDDSVQAVWFEIKEQNPNCLLLLGDNVYMDYGFSWFSDHPLYCSQEWGDQRFANELYNRYVKQSKVLSFRELLATVDTVGAIWDDHDFAWNNSHGVGGGENAVGRNKRLISKALFQQYTDWLNTRPLPGDYPALSALADLLQTQNSGIENSFVIETVRIILSDGRYYREKTRRDGHSSLLGGAQRDWIARQLNQDEPIKILCSGTTLSKGSEAWDQYSDLTWLAEQNIDDLIVLSGDIHKNSIKKHKALNDLYEIISSGAARPKFGGDEGNFGLLTIDGDSVTATTFDDDGVDKSKQIR